MPVQPLRVAFLVSGGGTTMAAILEAIKTRQLKGVQPVLVICSKPRDRAKAIERAEGYGLQPWKDIFVVSPKEFEREETFGDEILRLCSERRVNFIGQYGWMPRTPKSVVKAYEGMIVNQHPGPLDPAAPPGFDFGGRGMFGRRVMAARLHFVREVGRDFWTKAVAHRVSAEYDRGEVVGEKLVAIRPETTVDTLKDELLAAEHELQVEVLRDFHACNVQAHVRPAHWLVGKDELEVLERCKRRAIAEFPDG